MFSFSTLALIRMGAALIGGIYVARLLRNPVRVIVTRATPIQRRMANDFFNRLTRITTPVGILIAISFGILFNWGLFEAGKALGFVDQHKFAETITVTPEEDSWIAPLPEEWTPPIEPEPEGELLPVSATQAPKKEQEPSEKPMQYNSTPAGILPSDYEYAPVPPIEQFYLQIYAFSDLEKAQVQQRNWPKDARYACRLARLESDGVPYKVLIGPFPSRAEAESFRRKQKRTGFIRASEELTFWYNGYEN